MPKQTVTMSIDKTGSYDFYLYSDGMLETKTVNVVETKEFDISVTTPKNATQNEEFPITVHITNIANNFSFATLSIELEGKKLKDIINIEKGQTLNAEYNITATELGQQRLTVSIYDKAISSYTTNIYVIKKQTPFSFLDGIFDFFGSLFEGIGEFLTSIF